MYGRVGTPTHIVPVMLLLRLYHESPLLTFSAYRDFDSSEMLTDVQDQLCNEISKELVDLIFNATLGNW